jgi:hypothetical protein
VPFVRLSPHLKRPYLPFIQQAGFLLGYREAALANSRPAALDQNHQNDNKKHAGNRPDNRYIVHVVLLSNG